MIHVDRYRNVLKRWALAIHEEVQNTSEDDGFGFMISTKKISATSTRCENE